MGDFYDMSERALTESLEVIGETFMWQERSYACALDHMHHRLTTQKSLFAGARYPKWGQLIVVAGKVRQVTKLNGSALVTSSGGMVEDPPFTDDASDPSLEIEYDVLLKRT
jgi:hypothetical protein